MFTGDNRAFLLCLFPLLVPRQHRYWPALSCQGRSEDRNCENHHKKISHEFVKYNSLKVCREDFANYAWYTERCKLVYRVFFLTGAPPKSSKYKKVTLG